jgi:hypothetical protein
MYYEQFVVSLLALSSFVHSLVDSLSTQLKYSRAFFFLGTRMILGKYFFFSLIQNETRILRGEKERSAKKNCLKNFKQISPTLRARNAFHFCVRHNTNEITSNARWQRRKVDFRSEKRIHAMKIGSHGASTST